MPDNYIPDIHFSLGNNSLPLALVVNDTNPKSQLVTTLTYISKQKTVLRVASLWRPEVYIPYLSQDHKVATKK
jgi:hypothetical protein